MNRKMRRDIRFKRNTPNDQGTGTVTVGRDVVDLIKAELLADLKKDEGEGDAPASEPAPEPDPNPAPSEGEGEGDVKNTVKPVFNSDGQKFDNTLAKSFGTTKAIQAFHAGNYREVFKKSLVALANKKEGIIEDVNASNLDRISKFESNIDLIQKEYGVTGRYLVSKNYNTGTADGEDESGGAVLIPPPEALIGIERYEDEHGEAFRECTVRTTNRRETYGVNGEDNVTLVRLGEGAQKSLTNPSYSKVSTELTKAAGITFSTDELISDDVHGFVNDVLAGFANARARLADELVFTDDGDNPTGNIGLLNLDGTRTKSVGATINDITWEAILQAYWATKGAGRANIKLAINSTNWGVLTTTRNELGTFDWNPTLGTNTPFGIPAVLAEILPDVTEVSSNTPFAVMGDFKKTDLIVNGGLVIETSNTAVHGAVNAWAQDLTSFRAVTRMAKLVRKPERYTVLHTGELVS